MTSKPRFLTFVFLACAALAGSQARAGLTISADFSSDTTRAYSSYYGEIQSGLQTAANEWGQYLKLPTTTLTIQFNFTGASPAVPTANAGSLIGDRSVSSAGNVSTFMLGTLYKLTQDPTLVGPGGQDAIFNLSDNWLNLMSFGNSGGVPGGKLDANYVFMHELGHILGFISYRGADGKLPVNSLTGITKQYTYDAQTEGAGGLLYQFTGTNAKTANHGAPVPLTDGSYSHIGNKSDTDLKYDVMYGVNSYTGYLYELSGRDVGILADLGYTLTAAGRALVGGPTTVPEPASILALTLGLCGVGGWSASTRRRRAA